MNISRRAHPMALWIVLATASAITVSCGGSGETDASATPGPSGSATATTSSVSGTATATATASPTATQVTSLLPPTTAAGTATSQSPTPTATPLPAHTATPTPTPRPAFKNYLDESDGYSITVPTQWNVVKSSSDGVVTASGNSLALTIKTSFVDRSTALSIQIYAAGRSPVFPGTWTNVRLLSTISIRDGAAIEYYYNGTLNGNDQAVFIHWYLRGDRLIEVMLQTDATSWEDIGVQNNMRDILASFVPDAAGAVKTVDQVLEVLNARFLANVQSGIIARDEELQGTVELTCVKAVGPFLQTPQYTGPGEWLVQTNFQPYGFNEWRVYETGMQVVAGAGNASRC